MSACARACARACECVICVGISYYIRYCPMVTVVTDMVFAAVNCISFVVVVVVVVIVVFVGCLAL